MSPALLILAGYLVGSVPTSHWVGRWVYGVELREKGSGNLGATNTFRVLGPKAAVPVLCVDVAKGWLPAALFPAWDGSPGAEWAVAYGAAAILGHAFSFWVGFKGGKGVATGAGVFLALAPWALLLSFLLWVGGVLATRTVSVGSLLAAVTLPVWVVVAPGGDEPGTVAFALCLSLFVVWAHRKNVHRLIRGEEPRFGVSTGKVESV